MQLGEPVQGGTLVRGFGILIISMPLFRGVVISSWHKTSSKLLPMNIAQQQLGREYRE